MTIKHLVVTGGGPYGFYSFGILGYLKRVGFFDSANIETIYATSIGCIAGLFMVMKKTSYDELHEYIINKPVVDLLRLTPDHIFDMYSKKGVYDGISIIRHILNPIFHSEGVSPEITMSDFYDMYGVSLNFMCTDINNDFSEYCISRNTQPDMPVYKAIAASASIPFVFYPVPLDNMCLVDGGAVCNYPLPCLLSSMPDCDRSEIIGIRNNYIDPPKVVVNQESTILNYIHAFVDKLMNKLDSGHSSRNISILPYEVIINITGVVGILNTDVMNGLITSKESRKELITHGFGIAKTFLESISYKNSKNGQYGIEDEEGIEEEEDTEEEEGIEEKKRVEEDNWVFGDLEWEVDGEVKLENVS